jgi:hypothetical protein
MACPTLDDLRSSSIHFSLTDIAMLVYPPRAEDQSDLINAACISDRGVILHSKGDGALRWTESKRYPCGR